MSSDRGDGALNSTQKDGSGLSDKRRVSNNQDDLQRMLFHTSLFLIFAVLILKDFFFIYICPSRQ